MPLVSFALAVYLAATEFVDYRSDDIAAWLAGVLGEEVA